MEAAIDACIDMAFMRHMRCGKRGVKSWPTGGDARIELGIMGQERRHDPVE